MKIVKYPHPALRTAARPVTAIDEESRSRRGADARPHVHARGARPRRPAGRAPVRLLVMNFEGDPEKKESEFVAINPVIIESKGVGQRPRGVPQFPGAVPERPPRQDREGAGLQPQGRALRDGSATTCRPASGSTRSTTSTACCSSTRWARSACTAARRTSKSSSPTSRRTRRRATCRAGPLSTPSCDEVNLPCES